MCMYFKVEGGDYVLKFERQLKLATAKRWTQSGEIFKLFKRPVPEVSFWFGAYPVTRNTADVVLEIRDEEGTASKLIHRNVAIVPSELEERVGRNKGLHNGYLVSNATWILISGSFWNSELGARMVQYPERAIRQFLTNALDSSFETSHRVPEQSSIQHELLPAMRPQ
jgi:hypothetical protein